MPHGGLWSTVILIKWVIMGARGRASLSYVPKCAVGVVSSVGMKNILNGGRENE